MEYAITPNKPKALSSTNKFNTIFNESPIKKLFKKPFIGGPLTTAS